MAGEAEIQQQMDSRDGGSSAHTAQQRNRGNTMEHTDFYGCAEMPVPYKQNPLLNQENQNHATKTDNQNPVMQTPCN